METSYTLYKELDQLVEDLLYLEEIEKNSEDKMNVTIFIPPKIDNQQKYLWRTITTI